MYSGLFAWGEALLEQANKTSITEHKTTSISNIPNIVGRSAGKECR